MLATALAASPYAKEKSEDATLVFYNNSSSTVVITIGSETVTKWGQVAFYPGERGAGRFIDSEIPHQQLHGPGWILVESESESILLEGFDWDFYAKWRWCSVEVYDGPEGLTFGPLLKHSPLKGK